MDENKKQLPPQEDYLPDEPPLAAEVPADMPELTIYQSLEALFFYDIDHRTFGTIAIPTGNSVCSEVPTT